MTLYRMYYTDLQAMTSSRCNYFTKRMPVIAFFGVRLVSLAFVKEFEESIDCCPC